MRLRRPLYLLSLVTGCAVLLLVSHSPASSLCEDEFRIADLELNRNYKELSGSLNAADRQGLVGAQRAWITYRDSACKFEGSRWNFSRESAFAPRDACCMARLSRQRTRDLLTYTQSRPPFRSQDLMPNPLVGFSFLRRGPAGGSEGAYRYFERKVTSPNDYIELGVGRYLAFVSELPEAQMGLYFVEPTNDKITELLRGAADLLGMLQDKAGSVFLLYSASGSSHGRGWSNFLLVNATAIARGAKTGLWQDLLAFEQYGDEAEEECKKQTKPIETYGEMEFDDVDRDGYMDIVFHLKEHNCKTTKTTARRGHEGT